MWAAIADFAIWVLGLFGFGKPDTNAAERKTGEDLGKSEATEAGERNELVDIQKASDARSGVSNDPGGVSSDPNNSGPAGG